MIASTFRAIVACTVICAAGASFAQKPPSVFIEELTWEEVRSAVAAGATAIVYAGSTEQNGPHMVLGKHNFVAHRVGELVARRLGNALVYPVIPFAPTGDALQKTGHMAFAGSVSLSEATFSAVVQETATSAIAAGFKGIALMGDHGGGQDQLRSIAAALDRKQGARVMYIGDLYYKSQQQATAHLAKLGIAPGAHAGVLDTSELLFVDGARRWVRRERIVEPAADTGVDGDPRAASADLGRIFIGFKVDNAVRQIRALLQENR
jgi:creatinine amidohydrolase